MAARVPDRALLIVLATLVVVLVTSVVVGLVVTHRPQLDPVPVPTLSQS